MSLKSKFTVAAVDLVPFSQMHSCRLYLVIDSGSWRVSLPGDFMWGSAKMEDEGGLGRQEMAWAASFLLCILFLPGFPLNGTTSQKQTSALHSSFFQLSQSFDCHGPSKLFQGQQRQSPPQRSTFQLGGTLPPNFYIPITPDARLPLLSQPYGGSSFLCFCLCLFWTPCLISVCFLFFPQYTDHCVTNCLY